jgi:hypothetical protein
MDAQMPRVTDQAESCLVSQDHSIQINTTRPWSNDTLERGIVDLYARRMSAIGELKATERQEALDRIVTTQPFGRAFTAQPSYPPDPTEIGEAKSGGIAGLRRRLAGASTPSRKLATS